VDPSPSESPSPPPRPKETAPGPIAHGREAVYLANLEAFGARAARLCCLLQRGRLTADSCFLALTQLWIQLARSHRRLDDSCAGAENGGAPTDPGA